MIKKEDFSLRDMSQIGRHVDFLYDLLMSELGKNRSFRLNLYGHIAVAVLINVHLIFHRVSRSLNE